MQWAYLGLAGVAAVTGVINSIQIDSLNSDAGTPDLATLQRLLGNFENTRKLVSDLLRLQQYIETASELPTTPGSN